MAEELKRRLEQRFPGLKIVGTYTPPFRPLTSAEEQELARRVEAAEAGHLLGGAEHAETGEVHGAVLADDWTATLFFGVGAAFDFHAGRMRQAPRWMQRSGLEWLFRLGCDPGRLWKRYLKNNPLFMLRAFCQLTGIRKYRLE